MNTPKVISIGIDGGPSRCLVCGAEIVTVVRGNGITLYRHGRGEAQREFRYPDDYLASASPVSDWLRDVHAYEEAR